MDTKVYWELFRDTGEPIVWLLCRVQEREKEKRDAELRAPQGGTRG